MPRTRLAFAGALVLVGGAAWAAPADLALAASSAVLVALAIRIAVSVRRPSGAPGPAAAV